MTNEQLTELIQMGIDVKANTEALYMQNLPLLRTICKPYSHMEEMEDLLQLAFLGVLESIPHYDSTKGKFSTYMPYWVKQVIRRHLSECGRLIRLPEYLTSLIVKYRRFLSAYEADHAGEPPTDGEVCHTLNIESGQLQDIKKYLLCDHVASLDVPIDSEAGENTLLDYIESPEDMTANVIDDRYKQELKAAVHEAMQTLTEPERDTLTAYFWNGSTLDGIATEKGITRERVRQQIHAAQRKLTRGRAGRILNEFAKVASMRYVGGFSFFKQHGSIVEWEVIESERIFERARASYEEMKAREAERMRERLENRKAI